MPRRSRVDWFEYVYSRNLLHCNVPCAIRTGIVNGEHAESAAALTACDLAIFNLAI